VQSTNDTLFRQKSKECGGKSIKLDNDLLYLLFSGLTYGLHVFLRSGDLYACDFQHLVRLRVEKLSLTF
jgi:hypothetical protein